MLSLRKQPNHSEKRLSTGQQRLIHVKRYVRTRKCKLEDSWALGTTEGSLVGK